MSELIVLFGLIILGYCAGTVSERRHYHSIQKRENQWKAYPVMPHGKKVVPDRPVAHAEMVYGSAVISLDYFKRVMASLRYLIGGKVRSYETLLDRARREAILRMMENSGSADTILNVRIETSPIGNMSQGVGAVEAMAYGTAITFTKPALNSSEAN